MENQLRAGTTAAGWLLYSVFISIRSHSVCDPHNTTYCTMHTFN